MGEPGAGGSQARRHALGALAASGLAIAVLLGGVSPARSQQFPPERLVTADGLRLDFPPNGVWRARARQVAAQRARLRSQGRLAELNRPFLFPAARRPDGALAGQLRVPVVLVGFGDTDLGSVPAAAQYDSIFFTPRPLAGRLYTVRTFYEEMSNGLLQVAGGVHGWVQAANPRTYYLDACGGTANALDCATGRARMYQLFTGALAQLDGGLDFSQYDNDGPDGIPDSGDDDGVVDLVVFVQPVVGGECRGRGIWAHRASLAGLGGAYGTNDRAASGGLIRIGSYVLVSGVGGDRCDDTTQIMGIGTVSHEIGHGLGLPDLYDVSLQTHGAGEWSLMGSANYTSLLSPGHLEAWSKDQLGWVVVRELTQPGSYALGPVVQGDTVLLIRPRGANPRGEYFLLENKQPLGADQYNLTIGSSRTGPKVGGLLVWHIDSLKLATSDLLNGNRVNAGFPHGVALVQADGRDDLERNANRGDAGDPYPGSTQNLRLARRTVPAAVKNSDFSSAGFGLAEIAAASGVVTFRFGYATVVRASDTLAPVQVSGQFYGRFDDLLEADTATVSVPADTTSADGRARFSFLAWSDGGAREHLVRASAIADSLVARLAAWYQLKVVPSVGGSVAASPSLDLAAGVFLPAGTPVRLVPAAARDSVFDGWAGDTTATRDTLVLAMQRPYTLSARFVPVLAVGAQPPPAALMGASYEYRLPVQGGIGSYVWSLASGQLPPGLSLFSDGRIAGIPEATGTYDFTLKVVSSSQSLLVARRLSVEAPAVQPEAAVRQLLKVGTELSGDQMRYFDLLGNRNGRFDLGDFLAWVKKTGAVLPAELVTRLGGGLEANRPLGGKP